MSTETAAPVAPLPPVPPTTTESSSPSTASVTVSQPVSRELGPVDLVEGGADLVIASTTDSRAAVEAALDGKLPPAPTTTTPTASVAVPPQGGGDADPDPAVSDAARTLGGRKRSLQDRLAEETYHREEARRVAERASAEAQRLREELDAIRSGRVPFRADPTSTTATPAPAASAPADPPEPTLSQFAQEADPYAAWTKAVAQWTTDRAVATALATVRTETVTARQAEESARAAAQQADTNRQLLDQYNRRGQTFAASVEGGTAQYLDTVQAAVQALVTDPRGPVAPPPIMQAHLVESETGPALFYHLVQDQEEYRRIVALPAGRMLAALGRYEERLASKGLLGSPTASTIPSTTVAAPSPRSPSTPLTRVVDALTSSSTSATAVTNAPPPPSLVGGSGATTTPAPLDDLDYAEFKKRRNAADRVRH